MKHQCVLCGFVSEQEAPSNWSYTCPVCFGEMRYQNDAKPTLNISKTIPEKLGCTRSDDGVHILSQTFIDNKQFCKYCGAWKDNW